MTTSQFLKIRTALLSATLLADTNLERARNPEQRRYYRQVNAKIVGALRTLDAIEAERSDAPELQQMALALVEEISSDQEVA